MSSEVGLERSPVLAEGRRESVLGAPIAIGAFLEGGAPDDVGVDVFLVVLLVLAVRLVHLLVNLNSKGSY